MYRNRPIAVRNGQPMSYNAYVAQNNTNPQFRNLPAKLKRAKYRAYLAKKAEKQVASNTRVNAPRVPIPPPPPPRYQNAPQRGKPNETRVKISECTLLFAQASIDPFSRLQKMPCIPDEITVPSFKYMSKCQTTLTVGTLGDGFVAVNPWTMAYNDAGATILPDVSDFPVVVTTETFASQFFQASGSAIAAGTIAGFTSNSPFTFADINSQDGRVRLVACGVEIMYTGELLNQSGAITVLQNNGLAPFTNGTTPSMLMNNPRSKTCANSKENRCYLSYAATDAQFYSYKPLSAYTAETLEVPGNYPMIIYISGATPGITFHVKTIAYFEAQLGNADSSPSESDPIGFGAFQAARTEFLPSDDPGSDLKQILGGTVRNVLRSVSGMGGTIGATIGSAFGNPSAGYALGNAAGSLLNSILGD
jgi:hypothetical protein